MIYYSLIYPFLIYAIPVWGVANKVHLNKIHILQKKVVRLILFEDGFPRQGGALTHSEPLFKNLEILIVYDIFKVEVVKFVYDSIKLVNPSQFHNYFKYPQNILNTNSYRNSDLLIPQARTKTFGLDSIKNRGAHI